MVLDLNVVGLFFGVDGWIGRWADGLPTNLSSRQAGRNEPRKKETHLPIHLSTHLPSTNDQEPKVYLIIP